MALKVSAMSAPGELTQIFHVSTDRPSATITAVLVSEIASVEPRAITYAAPYVVLTVQAVAPGQCTLEISDGAETLDETIVIHAKTS